MYTSIRVETEIEINYNLTLTYEGYVDVHASAIADALRRMVAYQYGGDDAGRDYLYDPDLGIICISGQPGWWDCRDKKLINLLIVADMLDGFDGSFSYFEALANTDDNQRQQMD